MTCEQIGNEAKAIAERNKKLESAIQAERGRNQAVGYFAAVGAPFLLPLGLALEPNIEEKRMLDDNQARTDQLILLRRVKNCPS